MPHVSHRAQVRRRDAELFTERTRECFVRAVAGVERDGQDVIAPPASRSGASLNRRARTYRMTEAPVAAANARSKWCLLTPASGNLIERHIPFPVSLDDQSALSTGLMWGFIRAPTRGA